VKLVTRTQTEYIVTYLIDHLTPMLGVNIMKEIIQERIDMNKFIIKSFNMEHSESPFVAGSFMMASNIGPILHLDLVSLDITGDQIRKLNNIVEAHKPVSINTTEYMDWLEPFKNEFKEFLHMYHPDKILKDPKGYTILFGEDK
jgi:hypothetical protein